MSICIMGICWGDEVICNMGQGTCKCPDSGSGSTCTLKCISSDSCKEGTLKCRSGDKCVVKCTGKSSCASGTVIKGASATDVTIKCGGEDGCKDNIEIRCGTGDCLLKCQGNMSCDQFGTIDVDRAKSFECTGSCPSWLGALEFTASPTRSPTLPTQSPSIAPTAPTSFPSASPTNQPSVPTLVPTAIPTGQPTQTPTSSPSNEPTLIPTVQPTGPTLEPTWLPTGYPTVHPSPSPSVQPTLLPTKYPTDLPTILPTEFPSTTPSMYPSPVPSSDPSIFPSSIPTAFPSAYPSTVPTVEPTSFYPTHSPTNRPVLSPTTTTSPTAVMMRTTIVTEHDGSNQLNQAMLLTASADTVQVSIAVLVLLCCICFFCAALLCTVRVHWRHGKYQRVSVHEPTAHDVQKAQRAPDQLPCYRVPVNLDNNLDLRTNVTNPSFTAPHSLYSGPFAYLPPSVQQQSSLPPLRVDDVEQEPSESVSNLSEVTMSSIEVDRGQCVSAGTPDSLYRKEPVALEGSHQMTSPVRVKAVSERRRNDLDKSHDVERLKRSLSH